jgi:hypothetical protein
MSDAVVHPRTLPGQRVVNVVVRGLLHVPGLSRLIGRRLVTLYVVGRRTGRRYAIPTAYEREGEQVLVGTSFGWARNLRTGDVITVQLRGRRRRCDVQVDVSEADVVAAYARMARVNPAFAGFNRIRRDERGEPVHDDLVAAWRGGARVLRLTPRAGG